MASLLRRSLLWLVVVDLLVFGAIAVYTAAKAGEPDIYAVMVVSHNMGTPGSDREIIKDERGLYATADECKARLNEMWKDLSALPEFMDHLRATRARVDGICVQARSKAAKDLGLEA